MVSSSRAAGSSRRLGGCQSAAAVCQTSSLDTSRRTRPAGRPLSSRTAGRLDKSYDRARTLQNIIIPYATRKSPYYHRWFDIQKLVNKRNLIIARDNDIWRARPSPRRRDAGRLSSRLALSGRRRRRERRRERSLAGGRLSSEEGINTNGHTCCRYLLETCVSSLLRITNENRKNEKKRLGPPRAAARTRPASERAEQV